MGRRKTLVKWGKIILIAIYNGKIESGKCEYDQGIALNNTAKLHERILEKQSHTDYRAKAWRKQHTGSYRTDRSTSNLIFTLRMVKDN